MYLNLLLGVVAVLCAVYGLYQRAKVNEEKEMKEEATEKVIELTVEVEAVKQEYEILKQEYEILKLDFIKLEKNKEYLDTRCSDLQTELSKERTLHKIAIQKLGELSHKLDEYRNVDNVCKAEHDVVMEINKALNDSETPNSDKIDLEIKRGQFKKLVADVNKENTPLNSSTVTMTPKEVNIKVKNKKKAGRPKKTKK